jgi:hypothetical protein
VDYESCKAFRYDHITNRPSGWESYPVDEEVSSIMYSYDDVANQVCLSPNLLRRMS